MVMIGSLHALREQCLPGGDTERHAKHVLLLISDDGFAPQDSFQLEAEFAVEIQVGY